MKGHITCMPAAAELTVAQSGHISVVAYPQVPPGLARAGRDSADCTADQRTEGIATRIRTSPARMGRVRAVGRRDVAVTCVRKCGYNCDCIYIYTSHGIGTILHIARNKKTSPSY